MFNYEAGILVGTGIAVTPSAYILMFVWWGVVISHHKVNNAWHNSFTQVLIIIQWRVDIEMIRYSGHRPTLHNCLNRTLLTMYDYFMCITCLIRNAYKIYSKVWWSSKLKCAWICKNWACVHKLHMFSFLGTHVYKMLLFLVTINDLHILYITFLAFYTVHDLWMLLKDCIDIYTYIALT